MGMTIEEFEEYAKSHNILTMTKELYENRLKADKIAILTDLQMEIEELCIDTPLSECEEDMNRGIELAADAIQQKINKLKG